MKNIVTLFLIFSTICSFSQTEEKETVYLLFNRQSKEKCIIEDGSGNSLNLKKFRKEFQGKYIYFKICNEIFTAHKTKSFKDTSSIKILDNLKIINSEYLLNKYNSSNEFKHHVFDKVYLIEKISKDKIIKYEVTWIDEIIMIDD
ncbi:hypothetical protein [Winogradskyella sp. SM1960]|uniref:hypothetical protein n=1 Tax=Winogradskyella sp. SM1960 TaxID=2865955 RepID=UPI001CD27505|nr:hypothetical protein [Winogradskyella sp. SM1960]